MQKENNPVFHQGEHGIASILLGPNIPCARSTINTGKCACDGTSYFPVLTPKPYVCGSGVNDDMQITVKHPNNTYVVACNDCVGPGRMACLKGNVCKCNQDCPPGKVCDCINNRCVDSKNLHGRYSKTGSGIISESQPGQYITSTYKQESSYEIVGIIGLSILVIFFIVAVFIKNKYLY